MTCHSALLYIAACVLTVAAATCSCAAADAVLPEGVKPFWDLEKAFREKSPTRERICINGLWRWQPAKDATAKDDKAKDAKAKDAKTEESLTVPSDQWGFFKVPGSYVDPTQTLHSNPAWSGTNIGATAVAWYQRELTIPQDWTGRRITVSTDYVNSLAAVYVDGKEPLVNGKSVGIINFPGGEADITSLCKPGTKHILSALVFSLPMQGVKTSYVDSAAPKEVSAGAPLAHRGFCSDVYLNAMPAGARISDVKIETSFRKGEIAVDALLHDLKPDAQYMLRVGILDGGKKVKEFTGKPFTAADLKDGRMVVAEKWKADKLWDTITPQNMYELELSLQDAGGKDLDVSLPVRFGYREIWIEGRDFYLNGSRIFLCGMPVNNPVLKASYATYAAARETMERMKSFGINFGYTGHFGCDPGAHLGLQEILRAADDTGFLISFTVPHMGAYQDDWEKPAEEDLKSTYARHAESYVRMAENHPAVICYSMNHNAGGYPEDMDPDQIDGKYVRTNQWAKAAEKKLFRSEAIVRHLDSTRVIYHHGSGNTGQLHTSNFYPNFTPIQELSDWFEHWATVGVKPVYTNEYGGPFAWDWTMYRGYYGVDKNGQPNRVFGSADVPWDFSIAEWNSQFLGDRAFQISENEKVNLRFEGKKKVGDRWHRWDYQLFPGSYKLDELGVIQAMYFTDNFRAYRTWGVSAISPWGTYWKLRDGVDPSSKSIKVDWENLQRPGFSLDQSEAQHSGYENFYEAYERADWIPSPAAQALARSNMPLLAYIGGKAPHFTSKDHNFIPGESIEKQLIIINNSRATVSCDCTWGLNLPQAVSGKKTVSIKTGEQERIPLHFDLPAELAKGSYAVTTSVRFSSGETQTDSFDIQVLPAPKSTKVEGKIALFDPKGETAAWLKTAGITCQSVDAAANLSDYGTLIVGKAALTVDGPAPDIARVRDGLKVILFEQTSDVLEKRFGFRVVEYGLRNVYPRVPDHPLLAGLSTEFLRDWRGDATILSEHEQLKPGVKFKGGLPSITWCGMEVPKIWRCGCRGNVASVLIEKPACGDFLPIVDGGFSLQYSPLMEYHEGKGLFIFCQMDVTGRTENDPAAVTLTHNILQYTSAWKPSPVRKALYVGDAAGKNHLEKTGISVELYNGSALSADQVLIVAPGGGAAMAGNAPAIASWLKAGGNLLALGLDESEANAFLPGKVSTNKTEHIAAFFEPPVHASGLAGVGPSDVHSHTPCHIPLISAGATMVGDGVLAKAGNVVLCQMVPWQFPYTTPQVNKRTFRRSSFLVTRLLGNIGVSGSTPVLERFKTPANAADKRWQTGLYLDQPEEWDYPYRFFRW